MYLENAFIANTYLHMVMVMYIYIPRISHILMVVYNSSVGRDWMSGCKGATGSCYQSIF